MKQVTALSAFLLNRELWLPGDSKEVTPNVASELAQAGLVELIAVAEKAPEAEPQKAEPNKEVKKLKAK
jgi:hypothetical protein